MTARNKKTKVGYTCSTIIFFFFQTRSKTTLLSRDTIGRILTTLSISMKHSNYYFYYSWEIAQLFGICFNLLPRPLRPHADPVEGGGGGEGGVGEEEREWKLDFLKIVIKKM